MVLAGLVRLEGVEYYFAWKTLKSQILMFYSPKYMHRI